MTDTLPTVTAGAVGDFTTIYTPPYISGRYKITAVDGSTSAHTAVTEADAAGIDVYSQCSNDLGTGYTTGDTGCRWTNGNLQHNNSLYREAAATPVIAKPPFN